jgi:cytidylate kinase
VSLVAISASLGSGGSRIGPALAKRLGVPFVDRAIPLAVAAQLDIDPAEAQAFHAQAGRSRLEKLLSAFAGSDPGVPVPASATSYTSAEFRAATEEVLRSQAATGHGVILGRAAVVVLRNDPRVLRVRLDGPIERRIEQAMALDEVEDRSTVEHAVRQADRTHAAYAHDLYRVDLTDPALYHLVLDSTHLALDVCVELIAAATQGGRLSSRPSD